MDIFYNKKIAIAFTVLSILFSMFILGGNHLARPVRLAEKVFNEGVKDNPISVNEQIHAISDGASNLLVIAAKYPEADKASTDGVAKALSQFKMADEAYQSTNEITRMKAAKEAMLDSSAELSLALLKVKITDTDINYLSAISADLESCKRRITNSAYNDYAERANRQKKGVLAEIVAQVRNVRELPVF